MTQNPFVIVLVVLIFIQLWTLIGQQRIKRISESTHIIVNSEKTLRIKLIARLTERIAAENPNDRNAQEAAAIAREEAGYGDGPRRVAI